MNTLAIMYPIPRDPPVMSTFLLATLNNDDGDAMVFFWGVCFGKCPIEPAKRRWVGGDFSWTLDPDIARFAPLRSKKEECKENADFNAEKTEREPKNFVPERLRPLYSVRQAHFPGPDAIRSGR
jgi:hypothetical protein